MPSLSRFFRPLYALLSSCQDLGSAWRLAFLRPDRASLFAVAFLWLSFPTLAAPPRPPVPEPSKATSQPTATEPSTAEILRTYKACDRFFSTGDLASKGRFFRWLTTPKGGIRGRRPAYRIGSLDIPSLRGDCRFDFADLKASLVAFAKTALPPSHAAFLAYLQSEVQRSDLHRPIVRERDEAGFALERLKYALYALSLYDSGYATKPGFGRPPKRVASCPDHLRSGYQFALIPFRQHDLDRSCKSLVDQGIAWGFDRVTLFYPIPVSASLVGDLRCSSNAATACRPVEGRDYVFERLGRLGRPELHRCLAYLFQAGLRLNFVPHLESILTLNTTHEAETRVSLAIPHDPVSYYRAAYGDLLAFLRTHAKTFSIRHLRIAAAAEMDPSFLTDPATSLALIQRLRGDLRALGLQAEITWNPFNNFRPLERADTRNLSCSTLERLFDALDALAPSLYEEYGNIPLQGPQTFTATRTKFFSELSSIFRLLCPGQASRLAAQSLTKTFLIGEFALQSGTILYDTFHQQMRSESPKTDAVFWNTGSWDHLFGPSSDPLFQRFQPSILRTLRPCLPTSRPR